jgi:hypothetical protein
VAPEPVVPVSRRSTGSAGADFYDLFRWIRSNRLAVSSLLGVFLVAGGLLFNWGSRTLQGRFDQIEIGMTEREVRAILFPPTSIRKWRAPEWKNQPMIFSEGYSSLKHTESGGTVTIEFMDGRVTHKSLQTTQTASH